MKDKGFLFLIILTIVMVLASIPFIVDDAIKGQGMFMSTATYRDYIQQGK